MIYAPRRASLQSKGGNDELRRLKCTKLSYSGRCLLPLCSNLPDDSPAYLIAKQDYPSISVSPAPGLSSYDPLLALSPFWPIPSHMPIFPRFATALALLDFGYPISPHRHRLL
jgi:hypothetical protein